MPNKKDVLFSLDAKTVEILKPYMKRRLGSKVVNYLVRTYENDLKEAFKGNLATEV